MKGLFTRKVVKMWVAVLGKAFLIEDSKSLSDYVIPLTIYWLYIYVTGRPLGWRETAVNQRTCFCPGRAPILMDRGGGPDSEGILCHVINATGVEQVGLGCWGGQGDWCIECGLSSKGCTSSEASHNQFPLLPLKDVDSSQQIDGRGPPHRLFRSRNLPKSLLNIVLEVQANTIR